jgi:hypothetical protein
MPAGFDQEKRLDWRVGAHQPQPVRIWWPPASPAEGVLRRGDPITAVDGAPVRSRRDHPTGSKARWRLGHDRGPA